MLISGVGSIADVIVDSIDRYYYRSLNIMVNSGRRVFLSIDEILPYVGEFMLFQKFLVALVFLIYLATGYQTVFVYFSTMIPSWQCSNPQNNSECTGFGIFTSDDRSRCNMSRSAWRYTESERFSIATQFDIKCDEEWKLELVSAMLFIGWAFGSVLYGWMGDRFGRKVLIYPSNLGILVGCLVSGFMKNIYLIMLCRFIMGVLYPGAMAQPHILMTEFVGTKHRAVAGLIPFFAIHLGYCLICLKAYLLKDWVLMSVIGSAPYLWILGFYFITPRSVRWLQAKGKNEEAMEILRKVAKWNKKTIPDNITLTITKKEQQSSGKLFSNCKMTLSTLIQGAIWFSSAICYFGLQLAADDLEGSVYTDFIYLSIVAIPGVMIGMFISSKFGRKPAILLPLFIAGCSSLAVAFIPQRGQWKTVRTVLGIIGKCFATSALEGLYVWSVELFPTNVRSKGTGFTQACARVGCSIAPFAAKGLKPISRSLPFIALAIPALVSSVCGLYLPETKNRKMVNTIEQADENDNKLHAFEETEMGTINGGVVGDHQSNGHVVTAMVAHTEAKISNKEDEAQVSSSIDMAESRNVDEPIPTSVISND